MIFPYPYLVEREKPVQAAENHEVSQLLLFQTWESKANLAMARTPPLQRNNKTLRKSK